MRRGQIALEFVFMLLSVIVLTTFLASVAYYYITDYSEQRNVRRLQDLGYSLQNEVVLAYNVEPGYERSVAVPYEIDGVFVNISGTQDDIIIHYKGSDMLFRVPPVSGSFTNGQNTIRTLPDGSVTIS